MAYDDPRHAVLAALTQPLSPPTHTRRLSATGLTVALGGNPFHADPATVRFVAERAGGPQRLYWVTFHAAGGLPAAGRARRGRCLVAASRGDEGWTAGVLAGGGPSHGWSGWRMRRTTRRAKPAVNLCGQWSRDDWRQRGEQFAMLVGGEVEPAGGEVARVRLLGADGTTIEADVTHGVVMFLVDRPIAAPIDVELCAGDGCVVGTHSF